MKKPRRVEFVITVTGPNGEDWTGPAHRAVVHELSMDECRRLGIPRFWTVRTAQETVHIHARKVYQRRLLKSHGLGPYRRYIDNIIAQGEPEPGKERAAR